MSTPQDNIIEKEIECLKLEIFELKWDKITNSQLKEASNELLTQRSFYDAGNYIK